MEKICLLRHADECEHASGHPRDARGSKPFRSGCKDGGSLTPSRQDRPGTSVSRVGDQLVFFPGFPTNNPASADEVCVVRPWDNYHLCTTSHSVERNCFVLVPLLLLVLFFVVPPPGPAQLGHSAEATRMVRPMAVQVWREQSGREGLCSATTPFLVPSRPVDPRFVFFGKESVAVAPLALSSRKVGEVGGR